MTLAAIVLPIVEKAALQLIASYSKDINWDMFAKKLEDKIRVAVPGELFDDQAVRLVDSAIQIAKKSLQNADKIDVATIAAMEEKIKAKFRA